MGKAKAKEVVDKVETTDSDAVSAAKDFVNALADFQQTHSDDAAKELADAVAALAG